MPAFRFLHTADLHLGRRFGGLPEDLRGRLVEARHAILPRLAETAAGFGAGHVLMAGDTFDSETPSDPVWRQALVAMGAAQDLHWWIIPGNHDSLAAETLWARLAEHAPPNVHLLAEPRPVQIAPGVMLLPCPLPRRYPGRDLTAWLAGAETPPSTLRIGLAHGAIRDFSAEGEAPGIIPPDRAQTARLDYLALGDWHGQIAVNPQTHYPGTPERDGPHPDARGACLGVSLPAPGALPVVQRLETGRFRWTEEGLALLPGQDAAAALASLLPADRPARRDQLLRLRASGRATLSERAALTAAAAQAAPDFALLDLDLTALATEVEAADLDQIDRPGGALRLAADRLRAAAVDPARAEAERRISAAALNRLYGYLQEDRA